MQSQFWRLFQALNLYRRHYLMNHPVYQRDQLHGAKRRWVGDYWSNLIVAFVFSGGVGAALLLTQNARAAWVVVSPCCAGIALFGLIATPLAWAPLLSVTLGAAIVRERQRGTWDLLRVTPLNRDMLLLAKLRSTMHALKTPLDLLSMLWMGLSLAVGFGFTAAILVALGAADAALESESFFFMLLGALLLGAGAWLFLVDRAMLLLMMGLAALAAGSMQRSTRAATAFAALASLSVWLAEIAIATALLGIGGARERFAGGVFMTVLGGPTPGLLVGLPPMRATALILLLLLARELAIRALWRGVHVAVDR